MPAGQLQPLSFVVARDAARGIPCHAWPEAGASRTSVIIVHGLGDHGTALPYRLLAQSLSQAGHAVYSYDQRGHGNVASSQQGVARFPDLVQDLVAVADRVRVLGGDRPVVLLGLSMGALVALAACRVAPDRFAAIVAASAPLGRVRASPVAVATARVLGRLLPDMRLPTGIDLSLVASDPETLARYSADPWFHARVCAGLGADLLAQPDEVLGHAPHFAHPVLLLHGEDDRITPWDPRFQQALPASLCTVKRYRGARHNLFIDTCRNEIFDDITRWLCGVAGPIVAVG